MCSKAFGGVRLDIILCMSRFNHVPSGGTLRRDAISSYMYFHLIVQFSLRAVFQFINRSFDKF